MILFNGPLTASFKETKVFAIQAREFTIDFMIVASGGPSTVQCYCEFAEELTGPWFREIAQEDGGAGVVLMPAVVRTFAVTGGSNLPDGTYNFDAQFIRRHKLVRLQMAVPTGAARVKVTAPFGLSAS